MNNAPMNEFSVWPSDVSTWLELMADEEETADAATELLSDKTT